MKLIILKENLKQALSAVERSISENQNLPILKNVLLRAEKHLLVSATNLEIGVTYTAPAKINEVGSVCVPFAPLYAIIQNSDSERVNLSVEAGSLNVKTDNYEAKIQGTSGEEFPIIPKIENQGAIDIQADVLKQAINQVAGAAQVSELKPELSGILFDFQITILKLVATDSYRLAERSLLDKSFKTNLTQGGRSIIPLRTVQEVLRIFPSDATIKIQLDTHQVLFSTPSCQLISRLIDGTYPDYEAIIPKQTQTEITMEREQFFSALKLVGGFAGKGSDIKLRLPKDSKALELYSANQYVGENAYLVPVKKTGEGVSEMSFNARYLLDGVRSTDAQSLWLGLSGPNKPAIMKPLGDTSFFYIVMPLEGR